MFEDVRDDLAPDVVMGAGLRGDDGRAVPDPVGWVLDRLEGLDLVDLDR